MITHFDKDTIRIKTEKDIKIKKLLQENNLSMRFYKSALKQGLLFYEGLQIKTNVTLKADTELEIRFADEIENHIAQPFDLDIIYEDDAILVINKPKNLSMHPTKNTTSDTFLNYVAHYFNKIGLKRRVRLVNRLDFDTTGLLLVAKSPIAHQLLASQIESDMFKRYYYAIITGHIEPKSGILDFEVERSDSARRIVNENSGAKTYYETILSTKNFDLLNVNIITGRTHQIRAQMAHIGNAILGDKLYGNESKLISRQALTAYKLVFNHPYTNERLNFEIELPKDMKFVLDSDI